MTVTWLGHSCFKIERKVDGQKYTVVFDPTDDGYVPGLSPIRETADMVICSHEHGDHNARHLVELNGGLSDAIPDVNSKEPSVVFGSATCPYIITQLESYHDESKGSQRGKNKITILDDGNFKFAHFGDIGCMPEPEQLEELQNLDLALIPVGGYYTVDGNFAAEIIKKINPRIVIPMHYRDDEAGFGFDVISTVDDFINAMGGAEFTEMSSIEIEPAETEWTSDIIVKVLVPQII